jgi:hypothetical protein
VRRSAPSKRPQRHPLPSVDPVPTRGPLYPLVFRMKHAWRPSLGGTGKSRGTPLWKPRSTISRGRWPICWTSGGTNSGEMRLNPRTVRTSRYVRWQRGWCEFPLFRPPCKHYLSQTLRKRKPWPTADSLEARFQPVNDLSDPAVIEAMRAYEYALASETTSTSPTEVLQAIRGLRLARLRDQAENRTGSRDIYLSAR